MMSNNLIQANHNILLQLKRQAQGKVCDIISIAIIVIATIGASTASWIFFYQPKSYKKKH